MLITILLLISLCICVILGIVIDVLWTKLQRCRQHAESWKIAAEHWEKKANGW